MHHKECCEVLLFSKHMISYKCSVRTKQRDIFSYKLDKKVSSSKSCFIIIVQICNFPYWQRLKPDAVQNDVKNSVKKQQWW